MKMKWIKKFESSNVSRWREITQTEAHQHSATFPPVFWTEEEYDEIIAFKQKLYKKIRKKIVTLFVKYFNGSPKLCQVHERDITDVEGIKLWLKNNFIITIEKRQDDWFMVRYTDTKSLGSEVMIADEMDGLLDLLQTKYIDGNEMD